MNLDSGKIDRLWCLVRELKEQNRSMRNFLSVLGVLVPNDRLRLAINNTLETCDENKIKKLEEEADKA